MGKFGVPLVLIVLYKEHTTTKNTSQYCTVGNKLDFYVEILI